MRFASLSILSLLLLLTACNAPVAPQPTPTLDAVGTQVAILMTNQPTETLPADTPTIAPSDTQAPPTETPVPATETPTPTATSDFKTSLGNPTWSDTLDSGKSFYLFENEGTKVTVENGGLLLTGLQANGWLGWSLTFSKKPLNFYLEGTFIPQTCAGNDRYGLVFRAPNTNSGYFFGVTCGGSFDLSASDFDNNSDTQLVDSTSEYIHAGANQTNLLGVKAEGSKISLYANDQMLIEVDNTTFNAAGNFGAFVAANQTPGFTVKMDEIKLWVLP